MNAETLEQLLDPLSIPERTRLLTLIYATLTVRSRQIWLSDNFKGREESALTVLQGINELHHTLANQLVAYAYGEGGYSMANLAQQLMQIAKQYQIEKLVESSIEFACTRRSPDDLLR